jgi:ketosteroid isomerase-like protein
MHASLELADGAAIRSLEQGLVAAFRAKDVAKIMSFFAPGDKLLVFDLPTPRSYVGHEAYTKDWQRFVQRIDGPLEVELSDLDVTTNGSLAFGHCIVHVAAEKLDGGALRHNARVTHVYEKTNGKWLIVHEHISVPIEMATGKADFESKV